MLLNLFNALRAAKVPVSLRELLDLLEALEGTSKNTHPG